MVEVREFFVLESTSCTIVPSNHFTRCTFYHTVSKCREEYYIFPNQRFPVIPIRGWPFRPPRFDAWERVKYACGSRAPFLTSPPALCKFKSVMQSL